MSRVTYLAISLLVYAGVGVLVAKVFEVHVGDPIVLVPLIVASLLTADLVHRFRRKRL
jgi:hypothetical protein